MMNNTICNNDESSDVGFFLLLKTLKNSWVLILAITVLTAVLAYIASTVLITPQYQVRFTAYISNKNSIEDTTTISNADISASRSLAAAYAEIITSRTLLEEVAQNVGLSENYTELQSQVKVSIASNTQILTISVLMDDKRAAYQTALSIAKLIPEYAAGILAGSSMKIIDNPCEPDKPYSPNKIKCAILSAFLGLIVASGSTILIALLDDRIKSSECLERRYGIPVIGVIPNLLAAEKAERKLDFDYRQRKEIECVDSIKHDRKKNGMPEFVLSQESPFLIQEAYKVLRTKVTYSLPEPGAKCIGITSSGRNEGKSVTALNLAISYAQLGKRVVLIDGDMRMPTIAVKLGLDETPGLSDILLNREQLNGSIREVASPHFHVITAGTISTDPTRLLDSPQMKIIISVLKKYYDYIFVDLPPANAVADASIVSKYADGLILVVRHEMVHQKNVTELMNSMYLIDAKVLGFVYNDAPNKQRDDYKYMHRI